RVVLKKEAQPETAPWGGWELDASLLSVLTEYEEHRLRENIKAGRSLYRIHAAFDLMTIDKGLDDLKSRLKPIGEGDTYLPSAESANENQIELDVILGATGTLAEVQAAVGPAATSVVMLPKRGATAAAGEAQSAAPGAAARDTRAERAREKPVEELRDEAAEL